MICILGIETVEGEGQVVFIWTRRKSYFMASQYRVIYFEEKKSGSC